LSKRPKRLSACRGRVIAGDYDREIDLPIYLSNASPSWLPADGRADSLQAAISAYGGEAKGALDRYLALTSAERRYITAFLNTLRAP
jgi:hypothetical protein